MSLAKLGTTSLLLLCFTFFRQSAAQSQEKDSIPPVEIGGFVDTYYSLNTDQTGSHANRYRNFDITSDQFVLSTAQVDIQRRASPIGFHVALSTGQAPDLIHSGNTSTMNLLMQGYLSFVIPVGAGLTVDAGKFVTHMGFETIPAKDNYNYSRSLSFAWAIPYNHIGLRLAYPISDQLSIGASISNGWNTSITSQKKTLGGTVTYTPLQVLSLTANWIGGPGVSDSARKAFRHVVEVVPVLQVTEKLTLAADLVYGTDKTLDQPAKWKGAALYARFAVAENSILSARGEVYDDLNGYSTGTAQSMHEITLTFEQKVMRNLLLRLEFRHDQSGVSVFDGTDGNGTLAYQNTIALAGIVTF
jgi:hypothetical protein